MAGSLALGGCTCLSTGKAGFDIGIKQQGTASWYGEYFHGRPTANGEIYDMHAMTAAHRTLPLGTMVRVTNALNGKQLLARVNDRGPYKHGRILDLSYGAAVRLNLARRGVGPIYLEVVGVPSSELYADRPGQRVFSSTDARVFPLEIPTRAILETLYGFREILFSAFPVGIRAARSRYAHADILRAPRGRRVADILGAEHRVSASTAELVLS